LAASGNLDKDRPIIIMKIPKLSIDVPLLEIFLIEEEETPIWFTPIWEYLTSGILPDDELQARKIKRISPIYAIYLYKAYPRYAGINFEYTHSYTH
jgi:hypothetical protein